MFFRNMIRDKAFWKTLLSLAIPIILQQLLASSLAIIDNLMVGRLGDIPVAAVGQSAQVAQLVNLFFVGICSGGAVFAAQYWGAKNKEGIRRTYGLVMLLCGSVAAVFAALVSLFPARVLSLYTNSPAIIAQGSGYIRIAAFSYIGIGLNFGFCAVLRSVEQVRLPVISSIVAVLVNVFFNGVLIFGKLGFPRLGIQGAAIATVIAAFVNPLVILTVSLVQRNVLRCPLREMFRFPAGFVRRFVSIALPALANEALWALGSAGIIMVYGRMGEKNVAALTINSTVQNLAFVALVGLCNACAVMIGKHIGEGDFPRVKEYAKRFVFLTPAVSLGIGLLVVALRGVILSCFSLSAQASAVASSLLLIYGLEMALRNLPYIIIVGVFRPGGNTRVGMFFDLVCLWGIALPLTAVLGLVCKWDFTTVYLCALLAEDIPKVCLLLPYFFKFGWIRSVTEEAA